MTSTTKAGSGHPSTSLSMVEIITVLYFGGVLRYDPAAPHDPDRDRFILSKGHGAPGLYAVLAEAGYFPIEDLPTLRKLGLAPRGSSQHVPPPGRRSVDRFARPRLLDRRSDTPSPGASTAATTAST